MKKQRYFLVLLSVLVLGLIFLSLKYTEAQNRNKLLQLSIDETFKQQLSQVLSSFSMEVNDYTYRSMLSSVSNVVSLSELTTYDNVNDDLDISLHYLYVSLREDRSKDETLSRIDELRDIFYKLVQDPSSKDATDRMIKITNKTFFEIEEREETR